MAIPPLNQNNRDPKKPTNWGRVSKTLSFWILIILIPLAFVKFSSQGTEAAPLITYSQYKRELERDNLAKVTVIGERGVTGEFKQPVTVQRPDGQPLEKPARKFNTKLPFAASDEHVGLLEQKGVQVDSQEPRPSFLGMLVNFLPYFILIAFWIFLF